MSRAFSFRFLIPVTVLITLAFAGCDKIEAPYGTVNISNIDTVAFPPPAFTPNYSEPRRVLVEDYTGHTCGNCPAAAIILENMVATAGDKVIGIAVHAGETFAAPAPPNYPVDYRTQAGEAFDAQFGITSAGQPNGMINRRKNGNVYYAIPNTWVSETNAILNANPEADAHVAIKSYHDVAKNRLIAYVHVGFLEPMAGTYKLAAYAVEDSIVGDQKWYGQGLPQDHDHDYVFNHMLRGSVSSVWGEDVATDPGVGAVYRKTWTLALKPEWNVQNLKVVAVLYKADTYEVVQPAEAHVGH